MVKRVNSDADVAAWSDLYDQHQNFAEVGRLVGRDRQYVHRTLQRYWKKIGRAPFEKAVRPTETVETVETPRGLVVETSSQRIKTLPQLLEACAVDPRLWVVKDWLCNKSEFGLKGPDGLPIIEPLFHIKAWLTANPGVPLEEMQGLVLAAMESHAPDYRPPPRMAPLGSPHMAEICITDHHFGLLSWHAETGDDWDSSIARAVLDHVVERLLTYISGFAIDKVLFALGNDWMHTDSAIDGKGGQTAKGTVQDVDTRWPLMFLRALEAAVSVIDRLRMLAPTEVVVVPGNHDATRCFLLGVAISAWYRKDEAVTVRFEPTARKYVRYGATLLGLCHLDEVKIKDLPLLMATEAPDDFAAAEYREWHVGHPHRTKATNFVTLDEDRAVRVRQLPSLVAADAWHARRGYRHQRAGEAYLWSWEEGYTGQFSVGVPKHLRGEVAA